MQRKLLNKSPEVNEVQRKLLNKFPEVNEVQRKLLNKSPGGLYSYILNFRSLAEESRAGTNLRFS